MKKALLTTFLLLASGKIYAHGPCERPLVNLISAAEIKVRREWGGRFEYLKSGRELYVEYVAAKNGNPTVLLLHGMTEDLQSLDSLANQFLKLHYGVIQVDLNGHGKTLARLINKNKKIPRVIPMDDNVADIQELLSKYDISRVVIAGHSMGAAVGMETASEISYLNKAVKVLAVVHMGGYSGDVYEFTVKELLNGGTRFKKMRQQLSAQGLNDTEIENQIAPLREMYLRNTQYMQSIQDTWADMFKATGVPQATINPSVEKNLIMDFREYLEDHQSERGTPLSSKEIEYRIQAAVATLRGLSSFNLLHGSRPTPLPRPDTPILIIGGLKDEIITPEQNAALALRLQQEGYNYKYVKMANADHDFPRTRAASTFVAIWNFLNP